MSTPHGLLTSALRDAVNAGGLLESERLQAVSQLRTAYAARDKAVKLAAVLEREVAGLKLANEQLVSQQFDDAKMISALQARVRELETEPLPAADAVEIVVHMPGAELQRAVALVASREPGTISLLVAGPGANGPLELTSAHAEALTGRTLRIAGAPGSSLGPISIPQGAGISDCTIELWGIALLGGTAIYSPGFELKLTHGSSAKAPIDIGPATPA